MRNLTPMIKSILRNNPQARASDRVLIIEVLQHLGADLSEYQISKIKSVNFESVRRTRQKIQERGEYLPDESVQKARYHKSLIMQQNAPTAKPERVEHIAQHVPLDMPRR